jgi:hypothetical protein
MWKKIRPKGMYGDFKLLLTCAPSEKKWEVFAQFWEALPVPKAFGKKQNFPHAPLGIVSRLCHTGTRSPDRRIFFVEPCAE